MRRDRLFVFVIGAALIVIVLFGAASVILALDDPSNDKAVTAKIVTSFQAMFSAVIAFAVGYLVGHNGNGNGKDVGRIDDDPKEPT